MSLKMAYLLELNTLIFRFGVEFVFAVVDGCKYRHAYQQRKHDLVCNNVIAVNNKLNFHITTFALT